MVIQHDVSLLPYNTFHLQATADSLCEIKSAADLGVLYNEGKLHQPMLILGGGSNIVFTRDYEGLVLLNRVPGRTIIQEDEENVLVELGGGENWHACVQWSVNQGWGGIENMSLIPGTVGAAPVQNIGAYGVELKDVFHSLIAFDMHTGMLRTFHYSDCHFGYRDSLFKNKGKGRYFILQVLLKLNKKPAVHTRYGDIQAELAAMGVSNPGIKEVAEAVIAIRRSKLPDPAELGNCGSFFKNPVVDSALADHLQEEYPELKRFEAGPGRTKLAAGWLIEKAGWKGFRRGAVGVHSRQALVLVNYGGGTGAEIRQLAQDVQQSVLEKFGVQLEMEVNIV
ncbi:MAG: UDP-N-acetylmuramate dehydrogenase [Bacteroidetes bacterium]|nr:UDP-N-acetylmuramate dehydrogenase [Bacteroidota bacterium]